MQSKKMLAILTAGTAITAAVGLAHHAPSAEASPLTEAPAFSRVVRVFNPDELPLVIRGGRSLGQGTVEVKPLVGPRLKSLPPPVLTARQRAEAIFNNDTLNKPACEVVKEMQNPIDPNPMRAATKYFTWPEAQQFVAHFTSLSGSDITQLAGTYCNARAVRGALNGLLG
jgi:hypothetical protein